MTISSEVGLTLTEVASKAPVIPAKKYWSASLGWETLQPQADAITSSYTATAADFGKVLVCSGSSIAITLPASSSITEGWKLTIVNENAFVSQSDSATVHTATSSLTPIGKRNVVVLRAGSNTVEGVGTELNGVALVIPPRDCIDIWYTSSGQFEAGYSTTVGWRDAPASFAPLGSHANDPAISNIGSSFMRAYEFTDASASHEKEVYYNVHLNHDYVMGTKVYPHVHGFSGDTTDTTIIGFGFQYAAVKGMGQQALTLSGATTYAAVAMNGTPYTHYTIETSDANAIPPTNLEPDTVISFRCFRDSDNVGGSGDNTTSSFWMTIADCHYLSTEGGTPLKAPPFYL